MAYYCPPEMWTVRLIDDCPILNVSPGIDDWVVDDDTLDFQQ